MLKRKLVGLVAMIMIAALALAGCNSDKNTAGDDGKKDVIELGYVQWACANANSHMIKALLEEKFDVEVNLRDMDAGLLWQSVSTGDVDFMVTAWLPTTHAAYYEELKDNVVDLGPLYEGAKIGLVVPSYVTINSIDELNANADKFNGQIIGIDAGAGIMKAAAESITDYNMDQMELKQSSDAAMTAELKASYEAGDWVVVTGWAPHWMFGAFDLKFLEDPKMSFGGEETINPITRTGFAEDYPEINAFLDRYSLDTAQFGSLIAIMEEYDDDDEAARAWIDQNRELVDSWFAE
jgi:glycine betaine/proline transport system substrate-binding protein